MCMFCGILGNRIYTQFDFDVLIWKNGIIHVTISQYTYTDRNINVYIGHTSQSVDTKYI